MVHIACCDIVIFLTYHITLLRSEGPKLYGVLVKTLWSFGFSECNRVKISTEILQKEK